MPFNGDEFTKELVRDPFARELQDILVTLGPNDISTGGNSPLRTAYEKASKWPMRHVPDPSTVEQKNDFSNEFDDENFSA